MIKKVEFEPTVKSELDAFPEEGCLDTDEGSIEFQCSSLVHGKKVLSWLVAEIFAILVSSTASE